MVLPSSRTSRTAPALNSSVKLRRVPFRFVSAIVDIVSPIGKMSTESDQTQSCSDVWITPSLYDANHKRSPHETAQSLSRSFRAAREAS